jgi:hypothetical protein
MRRVRRHRLGTRELNMNLFPMGDLGQTHCS